MDSRKFYDPPPVSLLSGCLKKTLGISMLLTSPSSYHMSSVAHGYNRDTDTQEYLHPGVMQSPLAFLSGSPASYKSTKRNDPDMPSCREALSGPHAEEFWKAMDKEMASLEEKGTWELVDRSSLPPGVKVVPGAWVQTIKRYPDGRLNKWKSRWVVRGDLQNSTGQAYSPLVGLPTI